MKKIYSFIILVLFVLGAKGQHWSSLLQNETPTFFEIQDAFNEYWKPYNLVDGKYTENGIEKKAYGWKQFKRWEWYWEPRVDENGLFPNSDINFTEWQNYSDTHPEALNNSSSSTSSNWTYSGSSSSTGGYAGVGRLNCIAFHPTNTNTFWVGSPAGGLWKTTDAGQNWTSTTDNLPVLGVSDIAIDNTNPNTMYIATGDGDRAYSLSNGAGDTKSMGVLKSIDGGATWNLTGLNWSVTSQKLIRRLLIHPTNSQVLIAATSDGIWRTSNGGVTWNQQQTGYFIDVEFKPGNPNFIYAATYSSFGNSQIYRSTNNGLSFSSVHSFSDVIRCNLAVSAASSNLVDVLAVKTDRGLQGLYSSSNSGASFANYFNATCANNLLCNKYDASECGGQGGYDLAYAINPNNENERWLGGINTWKTSDGGVNWNLNNFWTGYSGYNPNGVTVVHADKHFIAFHPITNDIYECNDGGLYVSDNGGVSWTDLSNGLGVGQIYRIGTSATQLDNVICGLQDNGSKELTNGNWDDVTGGDGMECIIDYTNSNIEYGTYVYGQILKTTTGGYISNIIVENNGTAGTVNEPGAWVTPYLMHPTNNNKLIVGKSQVYQTTDGGTTWSQLGSINGISGNIRSMAYAPSNPQVIYAATDYDLYKTTNGGVSWSLLTSSTLAITYISVHPTNPNKLWYTQSGYSSINKVQYYNGSSWTNFSGTLPNVPVNCIVYETGANDGLYVGTDLGVYYRNANMTDWVPFATNLPNVVVNELEISYVNNKIWAGTFGRGLWNSPLYVQPVIGCVPTAGVFWQEDFSNGIPTTWTNSTAPWVYRGASTAPNNTVGGQGAYSGINNSPATNNPIASATAANGFLIFDSDFYDNAGVAGAFGTGIHPTPHIGYLTTENIDLSQYTDVRLRFNSYFRTYAGEVFVEFSTNGGATFGNAVQIHANLAVNEGTIADEVVSVNLPSGIAGNSNVKIRFVFEGQTNVVGGFTGYYFWQLDDIELMETPSCEFSILDVNYGGWHTGGTGGIDFTQIPLSQVTSNSFLFEANIANSGVQNQTNTQLNVSVNNSQYFNSILSTLVSSDTSIFNISNPSFLPNTIGSYQINYSASSDDIISSDTTSLTVEVTDSVYSFDNGIAGGSSGVGRQCGGMQLGNVFEVFNTDSLSSVSAHVTDYSVPGAQMFAVLYEMDTTNFNAPIWLAQTNDYTITTNDTNNRVTLSFNQHFIVQQGFYMVAIGGYAHPIDTFGISNSITNARQGYSKIQDNGCNLGSGSFGDWYWVSKVPMIRANFVSVNQVSWNCINDACINPATGQGTYASLSACQSNCVLVNPSWDCDGQGNCSDPGTGTGTYDSQSACEGNCIQTSVYFEGVGLLMIYPNPNDGYFTIEFSSLITQNVQLKITNAIGELVFTDNLQSYIGEYKRQINLQDYSNGIYFLNIETQKGITNKKIVLY